MADLVVSVSGLRRHWECPAQWMYSHLEPDVRGKTDYPRLAGIQIHRHLQQLEGRKTAKPRRFYYQTLTSAVNGWKNRWKRAVREAFLGHQLLDVDPQLEAEYLDVGKSCVTRYWKGFEHLPRPAEIERRCRIRIAPGIILEGTPDQVRPVSMDWIQTWRPDLIRDGQLDSRYNPEVIWDCKTGKMSYDARQWKENPHPEDWARLQYSLHRDIQFTAYTFLYQRVKGKLPLACVSYHARTGQEFPTFRDETDFGDLFLTIKSFLRSLEAQLFEKYYGDRCLRCDFMLACSGERPFLVVRPGLAGEEEGRIELVPNLVKKVSQQLRLKFPLPRLRIELPEAELPSAPQQVILRLPLGEWDEGEKFKPRIVHTSGRNGRVKAAVSKER